MIRYREAALFRVPAWVEWLFKHKRVLLVPGISVLMSCGSLQAQSVHDEPDFPIVLPVPELPVELLQEIPKINPSEILEEPGSIREDIPIALEMLPESSQAALLTDSALVNQATRPLRRSAYTEAPRTKPENPELRQSILGGLGEKLTQEYILKYSSAEGLAWLNAIMRRGGPYLAFIKREIETRKLPTELIYLPVIESAYIPTAVSRSGATGLWQFMKNSIAPYDMKITEWMDERMDFWKSTMGALSKLEENYRQLRDWPLALAAYNTGLGGLNRIIQKTGIKDYWVLSERKAFATETIHYVPKLLAIAHIMSNPRRFGLDPVWPQDHAWTRIKVGRTVDVGLLAEAAGVDPHDLKRANGELLYNVTPPDPDYHLKVRATDAAAITAVLERQDLTLIRYYFHTVKSGDTLSALAQYYRISVDHILNSNPGTRERYLKIGSRLLIPAFKEVVSYQEPPKGDSARAFEGTHQVKTGETLWSIARAYNIAPEVLANANGMGLDDILPEGKHLKTPIR
ncbi:MAG: LysM peptidoglycan-binding domain-containing protein [Treponema sp.]|jgi:membrane-bound lytic murein transglycosylase D|nr:LysM peptidoglycan-binding domain-containing protein [Treponema sp.]